jgi:hypothetical protein
MERSCAMSMSTRTLGVVLVMLGLVGCAAPVAYDHPTKPRAEKQGDYVECLATANQAASGAGNWSSDRILRSALFDHARDQYFAMRLESRGWYAHTTRSAAPRSRLPPAPPPKPPRQPVVPAAFSAADATAQRRCLQEALYFPGQYSGPRDGGDDEIWQQSLQNYLARHGPATDPAPSHEAILLMVDRDLAVRTQSLDWSVCLQATSR